MNKIDFFKVLYLSKDIQFSISDTNQINEYLKNNNYTSFGFITSWNPHGKKVKQTLNYKSTLKLADDISKYKNIQMSAKCDGYSIENGFLIFDISKDDLIKLQLKYQQVAIVYGIYKRIELIFNPKYFTN